MLAEPGPSRVSVEQRKGYAYTTLLYSSINLQNRPSDGLSYLTEKT